MSQSATEKDVIARRYGRVFFLLAEEQENAKIIFKDAENLTALMNGEDKVWVSIVNPTLTHSRRNEIVSGLVKSQKLSSLTERFLRVLVERDRLALLPRILNFFRDERKRALGQIDATLKSSTPVEKPTLTHLTRSLKKTTGFDVNLIHKIDPELLGGIVLEIGSMMVDASVGNRLDKLRKTMKG